MVSFLQPFRKIYRVWKAQQVYLSLPRFWFGCFRPETSMKRESGENPEQTRCCELQQKSSNNTHTTGIFFPERAFEDGASQKTCQTNCFITAFEVKAWKKVLSFRFQVSGFRFCSW